MMFSMFVVLFFLLSASTLKPEDYVIMSMFAVEGF